MKFSSFTVIALLSTESMITTGFTLPGAIPNTFRRSNGVTLQMASDEKLSKKEAKLQNIQDNIAAAEQKRLKLESHLKDVAQERLKLEREAEKASKASEFALSDLGLPAIGGAIATAAGVRASLETRDEVKEEKGLEEAAKKTAAEQDARNRASAVAAGEKGGSSTVSWIHFSSFIFVS